MKDDINETISFIQEIEKLYDHNLAEYSNRRTTELNWTKIGKKFNETGESCKSKWKGIRSSYIRSLSAKGKSGSSAGSKKTILPSKIPAIFECIQNYPQEGNLQSGPFTKEPENLNEESHTGNEETETNEADSTDSESRDRQISTDFDDLGESQNSFLPDTPRAGPSTTDNTDQQTDMRSLRESPTLRSKLNGKRVKKRSYNTKGLNAADKCAIDYFTLKKKKAETLTSSQQQKPNSCEMFLLSLVPQMESMTPRQQLSFQKGILKLIENIKYPVQSDSGQQDLSKVTATLKLLHFLKSFSYVKSHFIGTKIPILPQIFIRVYSSALKGIPLP
ncbi:unnamed protein product [Psylliodes chrysocephalus]|uniref:Transcription factor Adf-1 n=1 Tax=Psylliodes chrysocephalus TaxID=3402493 RepID=A0A9P0CL30_9CUCU|nr:unnamed protein product [Psylliodes chrysocephala]